MGVSTLINKLPNGLAQWLAFARGAAAGALTTTGGIAVGDRILQVLVLELSGALLKSASDLTSEFSITGTDAVTNTGGTSTAGKIVFFTFSKGADN